MAAAPTGVIAAPAAPPAVAPDVLRRLRTEAGTTPGRTRLYSLLIVVLLAVTAVATFAVVTRRTNGVRTVAASEPLIVDAQALDTSLSQADATAANAFLAGGIEPADQRALYQQDINEAGRLLADAAERSGPATDVQSPLQTLTAQLPVYTGLVDTARSNNRQGYPVGAAYLRQASRLMAGTILPADQKLFSVHASHLSRGSQRARRATDAILIGLLLLVVLAAMVAVQVWLFRRSNRVLNLPLVGATVLAAVLLLVVGIELRSEASQTARARDRSYASVSLVAQVRTLAFKAKGDESLTLIGRGNGGAFNDDFNAQVAKLKPLLTQAQTVAVSSTELSSVQAAAADLQQYLAVHKQIRTLDDGGQFDQAVKLAVGGGTASASNQAFTVFDNQLTIALDASQSDFLNHIRSARRHLANLTAAIVVVLLAAGLLTLWGFQQRINEYR